MVKSENDKVSDSIPQRELVEQLQEMSITSKKPEILTLDSICIANQSKPPPLPIRKTDTSQSSDNEPDDLEKRSYLKFLQFEIPKQYNNIIMIIIYNLTKNVLDNSHKIASHLKEDKIKVQYLDYVSNWAEHVHKEAEKLFSSGDVTTLKNSYMYEIDLNSIADDFRNDFVLAQSIILQFLLVLLQAGNYPGITRSLLNRIRVLFNIRYLDLIETLELPLSQDLQSSSDSVGKIDVEKERKNRQEKTRMSRWAWTSLGAVGGGVALAVSGGLAAPFILPYVGSILGASTLLAGTSGIALVTSIFGATGAGLTGYRISKRTASIKDFAFLSTSTKIDQKTSEAKPLHATICVSGWLIEEQDILEPWSSLEDGDGFAVRFETSILIEIGNALTNLFATQVVGYAASEVLKKTVIAGLISAIAWPMVLLQAGTIIDNPWSIGLDRADKAGKIMADALINRAQGRRPVTLVGFSLGGRAIFSCLQELLARSDKDASIFDIVENAFILGAPVTTSREQWISIKALVPGRLVNGFSSGDWILSFLHRAYSYGRPVAGNCDLHKYWGSRLFEKLRNKPSEAPVNTPDSDVFSVSSLEDTSVISPSQEHDPSGAQKLGIESIDFSGIVDGHLDYIKAMPTILNYLGFATTSTRDTYSQLTEPVLLFESEME